MAELSLPEQVMRLWGWPRAAKVTDEYRIAFERNHLVLRDVAMFCNAAAPIKGATEFDRGVEEGKRRVWLHVARMCGLEHGDFVGVADGTKEVR
jgi:hypothetical protein